MNGVVINTNAPIKDKPAKTWADSQKYLDNSTISSLNDVVEFVLLELLE